MRRTAGNLFIEHRNWMDVVTVVVLVLVFLLLTGAKNFDTAFTPTLRGQLYGSLATTAGALLGFVLAALAILVALPSGERMNTLRAHHSWPRVPGSYFRAAAGLLAALVLCTLGIVFDADPNPWVLYESVSVAALAFALARVVGAIFAFDLILGVSEQHAPLQHGAVNDPGP